MSEFDDDLFTDANGVPTLFDVVVTGDGAWTARPAPEDGPERPAGEGARALAALIGDAVQGILPDVMSRVSARMLAGDGGVTDARPGPREH